MSYSKQEGAPAAVGELVVKLDDTGDLVAIQCFVDRDPASNQAVFRPVARWINADGSSRVDSAGLVVSTEMTYRADKALVDLRTPAVIVRECSLLVLGEALTPDPDNEGLTIIPFGTPAQIAQLSIRNAIAAAHASTTSPAASEVL